MGLPMDDIHTPTIPSGPASTHTSGSDNHPQATSLQNLIAEKARTEAELKALSSVLDSLTEALLLQHGVNMNTSLTTFDGYPRDDIDVAQGPLPESILAKSPVYQLVVRMTRARIIRLRNDYKSLMSRIEDGLHNHHAQARSLSTSQPASAPHAPTTSASSLEAPFAKVNSVVAGSPAEAAGLKAGDKIRRFGDVDWINHEKLSKVAETVQRNEGVSH
ncbi:MAG: hypothetical protein Q9204_006167 [Flavoplaca sp. TL-2023a]